MRRQDDSSNERMRVFDREGITAVLPAYNEEANIFQAVEVVRAALETVTSNYEIIIVDDGSIDRTGEIADGLVKEDARIRVFHHYRNLGYGAALRCGFREASKGFCFHTDSDCQFDLCEMREVAEMALDADMVAGYRLSRADPIHRRLSAAAYNQLLRRAFGLRVKDPDCAFKLYRSEPVKKLDLGSDSILISAELLIKLRNAGGIIREHGVRHLPRRRGKQTGNSLRTLMHALRELTELWPELDGRGRRRPRRDI